MEFFSEVLGAGGVKISGEGMLRLSGIMRGPLVVVMYRRLSVLV